MDVVCPYCKGNAELVDSAEIYGRSYGSIWLCRPCKAYVGVHKNDPECAPLGTLADSETRKWRIYAHEFFDKLWKIKMRRDKCNKTTARQAGYAWLAEKMGIEVKDCHISMFNADKCRKVVEICKLSQ